MMSKFVRIGAAILVAGFGVGSTQAGELILNGGFEAGLLNWTVTDQAGGTGTFYANTGPVTPVSGFATVGASSGVFYGLTDQGGPGAHALTQSFTVPAGSVVTLSYDLFANDQNGAGAIVNPAGLDYTAAPNQHARVDILTAGADPLSTAPGDLIGNFYLGEDAGPNPHAYTGYSFDVTSLVGAGGTYQIRFGEVDNQFFFNLGVDNVSIQATTGSVPESTPFLPGIAGASLVAFAMWNRRQSAKGR